MDPSVIIPSPSMLVLIVSPDDISASRRHRFLDHLPTYLLTRVTNYRVYGYGYGSFTVPALRSTATGATE